MICFLILLSFFLTKETLVVFSIIITQMSRSGNEKVYVSSINKNLIEISNYFMATLNISGKSLSFSVLLNCVRMMHKTIVFTI